MQACVYATLPVGARCDDGVDYDNIFSPSTVGTTRVQALWSDSGHSRSDPRCRLACRVAGGRTASAPSVRVLPSQFRFVSGPPRRWHPTAKNIDHFAQMSKGERPLRDFALRVGRPGVEVSGHRRSSAGKVNPCCRCVPQSLWNTKSAAAQIVATVRPDGSGFTPLSRSFVPLTFNNIINPRTQSLAQHGKLGARARVSNQLT